MTDQKPNCSYCQRDVDEVPLIPVKYQDTKSWICPQHLPVLIHKPENLIGKLPGAENLSPEGDGHH